MSGSLPLTALSAAIQTYKIVVEGVDQKARGICAPMNRSSEHANDCFCRTANQLQIVEVGIKHIDLLLITLP
jgi:hypothetical protein